MFLVDYISNLFSKPKRAKFYDLYIEEQLKCKALADKLSRQTFQPVLQTPLQVALAKNDLRTENLRQEQLSYQRQVADATNSFTFEVRCASMMGRKLILYLPSCQDTPRLMFVNLLKSYGYELITPADFTDAEKEEFNGRDPNLPYIIVRMPSISN